MSMRPNSRRRQPKKVDGNRWMTTYADAITILMAFFVMLYAMSEIDVIRFTAFLEGLRVPFGNESGEGLLPATDGLRPDLPPPSEVTGAQRREDPDDLDPELTEEHLAERPQAEDGSKSEIEMRAGDQLAQVKQALDEALGSEGLDPLVQMRREERGLVVSVASDDILFALGSTVISELGREVIAVVSETLDGFPNPLMVEGHTDDLPLDRGGYTNWNLSTDRAVAVLKQMIEEHELPPARVGAVGYGEYHPIDTNETEAGRARNRRVDIVVLVDATSLHERNASLEGS